MNIFETIKEYGVTAPIEFNPNWANNTGYMNHAVTGKHAPMIHIGHVVMTKDDHSRTILITGTRFGNLVVFKRYENDDGPWVYNCPDEVKKFFSELRNGNDLSDQQVIDLFELDALGPDVRATAGQVIEDFMGEIKEFYKLDEDEEIQRLQLAEQARSNDLVRQYESASSWVPKPGRSDAA